MTHVFRVGFVRRYLVDKGSPEPKEPGLKQNIAPRFFMPKMKQ